VAVGRDFVAFLFVGADAADIWHEDPRFPRDVGADIPRVGERIERAVRHLVVVLDPAVLGGLLRFDAGKLAAAHVL